MLTQEDIEQQLEALEKHRRTLFYLLRQQAFYGGAFRAPPQVISHIGEERKRIQSILSTLRAAGVDCEDRPEDKAPDQQSSSERSTPMATQEDIEQQLELLRAHRRNLFWLLGQQEAQGGAFQALPEVVFRIGEARENIKRIVSTLRAWGVACEDRPEDEDPDEQSSSEQPEGKYHTSWSNEDIDQRSEILEARRRTLRFYLLQEASFGGSTYLPPSVSFGISRSTSGNIS